MNPGPKPYVPPPDLHPLFEPRLAKRIVVAASACWIWCGPTTSAGYGCFCIGRKTTLVHRYTWMRLRGPIPTHLQIDHLCRVRRCANPDHMELVTSRENTLRGVHPAAINAAKKNCPRCGGTYIFVGKERERRCKPCYNKQRRIAYRSLLSDADLDAARQEGERHGE